MNALKYIIGILLSVVGAMLLFAATGLDKVVQAHTERITSLEIHYAVIENKLKNIDKNVEEIKKDIKEGRK